MSTTLSEPLLTFSHNVDCIEVNQELNIMCVCTYEFEASTQRRLGGVYLGDAMDVSQRQFRFIDCGGVFDARFNGRMLGIALARGCVGVLLDATTSSSSSSQLETIASAEVSVSSHYCLCLDWGGDDDAGGKTTIVSGYSDGRLEFASLGNPSFLTTRTVRDAHCFSRKRHGNDGPAEIWSVASRRGGSLVASGGDDGVLAIWDARASDASVARVIGAHEERGVCCVVFDEEKEETLFSGGYDQKLRSWDLRNMSRPLAVGSTGDLGGGVWRVRRRGERLGLACMRGGFTVIPRDETKWGDPPLFFYSPTGDCSTPWEALAYGLDWLDDATVAGGTFYDRSVRIMKIT